jgi:hypothetical protein
VMRGVVGDGGISCDEIAGVQSCQHEGRNFISMKLTSAIPELFPSIHS